jgi:ZIP family zinc transporter
MQYGEGTGTGRTPRGPGWMLLGLLPLMGLGVLLALIVLNGAGIERDDVPPVEDLSATRVVLPTENEIVVHVTNGGPDPVTISQVTVNEALWDFRMEPDNTVAPRGSAEITIPYTWVEGEAYGIGMITSTGVTFEAEVPLAVVTPGFSADTFWRYALIGFYVGVVPVSLGLLWYPFLRRLGTSGMGFVLALTVGLLIWLVLDTLLDAVEVAGTLPGFLSGVPLVLSVALLTLLGLLGAERIFRRGREEASRLSTSYRIAAGIGLHNLGEGLASGAAFALGEEALGVFLVVGFTLHNITEGVGIAAPILMERPGFAHFVGLALLGGVPPSWAHGSPDLPTRRWPRRSSSPSVPGRSCRWSTRSRACY